MERELNLVVGLGNPGTQYSATRHNVGFIFLDYLAEKNNLVFSASKWKSELTRDFRWQVQLLLAKPETFMNLSGAAVLLLLDYYKLSPEKIIVVHDDIDLPLGRIRIVARGGSGGHKGIRSIIESLGTDSFTRIKIGIDRPAVQTDHETMPMEKYVLTKFSAEERAIINKQLPLVEDGLRLLLTKGALAAMNMINGLE